LRIAVARLEKQVAARRAPETLHGLGMAYLVLGDLNRAVSVLEDAAEQENPDARILSDLSAAYLARGSRNNSRDDLMKALTFANRALGVDAASIQARFNRAAVLERLGVAEQARDAWQEYVAVDPRSPWSNEARGRLTVLETALTRPTVR